MTRLNRFVTGALVAAAVVFSLSVPSPASAQARGARAAGRLQNAQHHETAQIRNGVKDGALTKAQARRLRGGMENIHDNIAADRANGKLTPQEAKRIKNETKQEEKAIRKAEDFNRDKSGTMPPTKQ